MNNQELEGWTVRLTEQVQENRPVEDSRVELKSEWPETEKMARQLAGHLNASRSQDALWIIGLDEKRGVLGAKRNDLANWLPQLQKHFDGLGPMLENDLVIPVRGKEVVALLFKSDRAPYVIKVPNSDRLEVPWRDGTRTRSATREEMLALVANHARDPFVEFASMGLQGTLKNGQTSWHLQSDLYIVNEESGRLVIPYHRCHSVVPLGPWGVLKLDGRGAHDFKSPLVKASKTEIILDTAGWIRLHFTATAPASSLPLDMKEVTANITLGLVGRHRPVTIAGQAKYLEQHSHPPSEVRWGYSRKNETTPPEHP